MRVLVVAGDMASASVIRDVVHSTFPSAFIDPASSARVPASTLAATDFVVLEGTADEPEDLRRIQELRAIGFGGPVVFLARAGDAPEMGASVVGRLGVHRIPRAEMATRLPETLGTLAAELAPDSDDELGLALRELRRTRQLIAAGMLLSRFQHDVNNPLTALLAEAQLLQMEELSGENREAVDRIVESCRRVAALVRGLDGAIRD